VSAFERNGGPDTPIRALSARADDPFGQRLSATTEIAIWMP
jgi:hypothetical protein